MIYIGSDHGGFALKEDLKKFLKKNKIAVEDCGPAKLDPTDDFPIYTKKVCKAVLDDSQKNPEKQAVKNFGILICRSGHGVSIAANRYKGIRAALCWNEAVAKASKHDDDANVLCLPADYLSSEHAEDVLKAWLETEFSGEERHARRLEQLENLK